MVKKKKVSTKIGRLRSVKKEKLQQQLRESSWEFYLPSSYREYDSYQDKHCPLAQIRRYNEVQEKKQKEKQDLETIRSWELLDRTQETFKGSQETFSTTSTRFMADRKFEADRKAEETGEEGAVGSQISFQTTEHGTEFDILQKVLLRERFLSNLETLVRDSESNPCDLNQISELCRALRYQTLLIVEHVHRWRQDQTFQVRPVFVYAGQNYLIKLQADLDFLDDCQALKPVLGFSLVGNPFLVPQHLLFDEEARKQHAIQSIDGISVDRLLQANDVLVEEREHQDVLALSSSSSSSALQPLVTHKHQLQSLSHSFYSQGGASGLSQIRHTTDSLLSTSPSSLRDQEVHSFVHSVKEQLDQHCRQQPLSRHRQSKKTLQSSLGSFHSNKKKSTIKKLKRTIEQKSDEKQRVEYQLFELNTRVHDLKEEARSLKEAQGRAAPKSIRFLMLAEKAEDVKESLKREKKQQFHLKLELQRLTKVLDHLNKQLLVEKQKKEMLKQSEESQKYFQFVSSNKERLSKLQSSSVPLSFSLAQSLTSEPAPKETASSPTHTMARQMVTDWLDRSIERLVG